MKYYGRSLAWTALFQIKMCMLNIESESDSYHLYDPWESVTHFVL